MDSNARLSAEMFYGPFSTGRFVAPISDHVMILLRILRFKFSNSGKIDKGAIL